MPKKKNPDLPWNNFLERLKNVLESFVSKRIKKTKEEDLKTAISKEGKIHEKAEKLDREKYSGLIGEVRLFLSLIKDYWNKKYTDIPWVSIAAAVFSLLYFLNPIDLIPDFILGWGFLDDAGVFSLVITSIKDDLDKYRVWKESEGGNGDPSLVS